VTNQLPVAILSWKTRISTRRFLRRPLGVLLSATGLLAPPLHPPGGPVWGPVFASIRGP